MRPEGFFTTIDFPFFFPLKSSDEYFLCNLLNLQVVFKRENNIYLLKHKDKSGNICTKYMIQKYTYHYLSLYQVWHEFALTLFQPGYLKAFFYWGGHLDPPPPKILETVWPITTKFGVDIMWLLSNKLVEKMFAIG